MNATRTYFAMHPCVELKEMGVISRMRDMKSVGCRQRSRFLSRRDLFQQGIWSRICFTASLSPLKEILEYIYLFIVLYKSHVFPIFRLHAVSGPAAGQPRARPASSITHQNENVHVSPGKLGWKFDYVDCTNLNSFLRPCAYTKKDKKGPVTSPEVNWNSLFQKQIVPTIRI